MNRAKYERQKEARTRRYELRKSIKASRKIDYLERKFKARAKYFEQKRGSADRKFEGRKQMHTLRGMQKMDNKAAKFRSKVGKWSRKWAARARRSVRYDIVVT